MYDLGIKTTFIHFRANGMTIKKIAEVMGINRTTLIQWNKELYTDIKIAEHDEFEKIFEENFCSKKLRVTILAEQLGVCYDKLAFKDTRNDRLVILREIEKLTRLLNIETEDRKYTALVQKSEKTVNKNFPIIVNDKEKLRNYDKTLNDTDEYFDNYDEDATSIYTQEDKEILIDKHEYEQDEKYGEGLSPKMQIALDAADEKARAMEEEELKMESDANCVVTPKTGMKRSKRILNIKPDMKVLKSKKFRRENKRESKKKTT